MSVRGVEKRWPTRSLGRSGGTVDFETTGGMAEGRGDDGGVAEGRGDELADFVL